MPVLLILADEIADLAFTQAAEQAQIKQGQHPALLIGLLTPAGKAVLVEGAFGLVIVKN